MAAMHYNAQMVSEDLHQHPRHLYNLQQRLQDPGSSPRSEDARSPVDSRMRSLEEMRFAGARSPDIDDRMIRYHEDAGTKRFPKEHAGSSLFQDAENSSRKCFSDELTTTNRCRESEASPRRTSSPQGYILSSSNQHNNSIGKTSFCIDALLGRATKQSELNQQTTDRQRSFSRSHSVQSDNINLSGIQERESPCTIRRLEDQRTSLGNPLHPFVQQHGSDSPGLETRDRHSANRESVLGSLHNESGMSVQRGQFRSETGTSDYRNDRLENVEDDTSVDVDPTRTGSASPGSNASRSPTSSPPISPGSEDPTGNGILGHQSLVSGPYGVGTAIVRQNQGLLLHPAGPLIHPGGLYYHPSGGSAFHSIHKEGQPVGHPQSGGPHPQQHHIHPLQLEWLARTGMLYPRLPADLAGECIVMIDYMI